MKIFTAQQIYNADKFTIEKQGISSDALMERAATRIFEWMHMRLQGAKVKIHLFCGIGNNGGDGIALARHLLEHDYDIAVYVVNYSDTRSKDFLINLDRLKQRKTWPDFLDSDCEFPHIEREDIVVDAIFGIGLNREPDVWVAKLITHINTSMAFVLAVDIPSGLFMDRSPKDKNAVVRANFALSFQAPKLPFFLPETGSYVNQWELLDIGLDREFLMDQDVQFEFIGKPEVLPLYRSRLKFSHKGSYGHAMIVGGSYGKIGAVQLAANACITVGSGLVSVFVPECGYTPIQAALPEIMVLTDDEDNLLTAIEFEIAPKVIGIGMGMGTHKQTRAAFSQFLETNKIPLVIDADGLNILAKDKNLLKKLPPETVLTPHPKELERLIGSWKNDFEKLEKAKKFVGTYNVILVLKGAHTITLYKDIGCINSTGNPGMATAGSGDVLAGMITGLIAQGYPAMHAAIFGVYLHGYAGDLCVPEMGYESLTASKLINTIGKAYLKLFERPQEEPKENVN